VVVETEPDLQTHSEAVDHQLERELAGVASRVAALAEEQKSLE
jgi:hypothetical protein